MRHGLILVEGQTEEEIVKSLISPYLQRRAGLWLTPTIVATKRVKSGGHFKGGLSSFAQVQRDLRRLFGDNSASVVTTLFDYYALPSDFPGMSSRPNGSAEQRVKHVQQAFAGAFPEQRNFLPFLALHEVEAWLYSDLEKVDWVFVGGELSALRAARAAVVSPEEIDEGYETAPSRRILKSFPAYQKTLHGPLAALEIGLDAMRAQCPHLSGWLAALEHA